jgi:hypothetical protein
MRTATWDAHRNMRLVLISQVSTLAHTQTSRRIRMQASKSAAGDSDRAQKFNGL